MIYFLLIRNLKFQLIKSLQVLPVSRPPRICG